MSKKQNSNKTPVNTNTLTKYYRNIQHSPPSPPSQPAPKKLAMTTNATTSFENLDENQQRAAIFELLQRNSATLTDVQESVASLQQHANDTDAKLKEHDDTLASIKSENRALLKAYNDLDAKFANLVVAHNRETAKRDDCEAFNRRLCLEINGVPKSSTETRDDCKANVFKVMKLVGMTEDDKNSIDDAHRKMGGGIIVKFKSRTDAMNVYSRRFKLKGQSSAALDGFAAIPGQDLYINESLTLDRSRLRAQVSQKLKTLNIGVEKNDRIKLSTSDGVVTFTNRAGKWIKCRKMSDFDAVYPNDLNVMSYE